MTPLLDAFVPAIGLLALGQLLRRCGWLGPAFWAEAEKLVFYLFLPALLVVATATVDLARLPVGGIAATIWLSQLVGTAMALALRPLARGDWPALTSAVQGAIRFNNLVGLALAVPLYGAEGLAISGVLLGVMVPVNNLICVSLFAWGGARRASGWAGVRAFVMQLAKNPLLVGCAVGFALNLSGIGLPAGIGPSLRALGQGAVALGLMAVGAALTAEALATRPVLQLAVGVIKLGLLPAVVWGIGQAFGLSGVALSLSVLFMALPTAASAYIMARQMGGDAPLMASITTTQHVACALTLPVVIALVG